MLALDEGVAALAPNGLTRTADDVVALGADLEDELDLGLDLRRSVVRAEVVALTLLARRFPKEGETDSVEDRGLAGAGRAIDSEEPAAQRIAEIHRLCVGEGAERGERHLDGPHD